MRDEANAIGNYPINMIAPHTKYYWGNWATVLLQWSHDSIGRFEGARRGGAPPSVTFAPPMLAECISILETVN